LNCRMYENKFPEVDDLVMVRVKSIAEMGAYVSLLEYNNIEGMILLSELSRRRIRSISKLIRVGRQEAVVVLRVDKEKGYIDLSKRRVSPEDVTKLEEKFNKSKAVHSIMRHVSETEHIPAEQLYQKFGWPLYKKYGHAYDGFRRAVTEPDVVFEGTDFTPQVREAFLKNIRRRMAPQPVKISAEVEVACFRYEGIDAIKDALNAGIKAGSADVPVKIKLIAPPIYVMFTQSLDKEKGIATLNAAIEAAKQEIQKRKGDLTVRVGARAISEREEKEMAKHMEELEEKNQEVDGDDDNEDEDGDGDRKKKSDAEDDSSSDGEADDAKDKPEKAGKKEAKPAAKAGKGSKKP